MTKYQKSPFTLTGKLKKVILKKGTVKYLKLLGNNRHKYWIKLSSKLRKNLDSNLVKGSLLKITGEQKQNRKTDKIKYKASRVILVTQDAEAAETKIKQKKISLLPVFDNQKKSQAKVLICQKSNCWKKGGKKVCEQLEANLRDRNLGGEIPIKKTGCLKKCKQAPNIVMLPDKVRYSKVKAKQIPDLIEKHLVV